MSDLRIIVTRGCKRIWELDRDTLMDVILTRLDATRAWVKEEVHVVIMQGVRMDGDDAIVRDLSNIFGFRVEDYSADFDSPPDDAVKVSNQAMVDRGADLCIAMPDTAADGPSLGTWDMIRRAVDAGIETCIYPVPDMSEERTFDLVNSKWWDIASDAIYVALKARYKALWDRYEQETEGYSWDNHEQWRSPSGESINDIRRKYPYSSYGIVGGFRYEGHSLDRAYDTVSKAKKEIGGRGGTCTIEGVSDPDSLRIRIALDDGGRITIGLCKAKPYSFPRIYHRYKPAEQAEAAV